MISIARPTRSYGIAALGTAMLASCSTAPAEQTRSPKAQQELAEALAGRVAGPPQRCIDAYRTTKVHVIDDFTIIYDQGRTVFVQNPKGGCPGLGRGDILVTTQVGPARLCQNEIARTVDPTSRMESGGCVLGPFTPYAKPEG